MFLKRIEMQGFKSFAERTTIDFESDFTGVVGPNGCGKSNITDAIRWVLGEQSAKNMRGTSMTDVIFSGSQDKRAVNMAEVTLSFDNSRHLLNSDYDQVEVTRRLYRNGEGEYLLNRQPCRLKDIIDLILDTGLGKDSLSIISQGNISAFAEAKPIERRALFEEAAGVAKYKKRKTESLNKLERTQQNIDRLLDVVGELEKQVNPLRKQADKALAYRQKKERLNKIEIAVLVNDINNYSHDITTLDQQLNESDYRETAASAAIQITDNEIEQLRIETKKLDSEVQKQQDELLKIIGDIQVLEKRKVEIDEKSKYIVASSTDNVAKREEIQKLYNGAKGEYEDRQQRYDKLSADILLSSQQLEQLTSKLADLNNDLSDANNKFNNLNNRKLILEAQQKAPFQNQIGVKSVIDAKKALPGVLDVVSNCFKPDEGYQLAVSVALGAAVYHVITTDEAAARRAIQFLKNNHGGRATFLPMSVMQPHYVNKDHLFVAEHTEGFLGLASDFVDCDEQYDGMVLSLLGNVLICQDLKSANELSGRLTRQYKVVTLDGDVVHRGGSMTGGFSRATESPLTVQHEYQQISEQVAQAQRNADEKYSLVSKTSHQKDLLDDQLVSQRIQLAQLEQVLEIKKAHYQELKEQYNAINPQPGQAVSTADQLTADLNSAYAKRDEITNSIATKRGRYVKASSELARKEQQLRQKRAELTEVTNTRNTAQIEKTRLITLRDTRLDRLSNDYQMTFEHASQLPFDGDLDEAKNEVNLLRAEINELGNINMEAPEQFTEINDRYEFMVKQLDDLKESRQKLLQAINEMDEVMASQFSEMFTKINNNLQDVFTVLFGGGKARLLLEDPNDILNTGIDIDVQPPGKNIQNIRLFSGGEKSLIAICVLFSILKARPLPLCIFDEVESSLDQGNVDRFARYIHQFSNDSQFIVITHRPGTMTECDVLYGVTMPTKGVSKLIKVKLKEALNFSEEVTDDGHVPPQQEA